MTCVVSGERTGSAPTKTAAEQMMTYCDRQYKKKMYSNRYDWLNYIGFTNPVVVSTVPKGVDVRQTDRGEGARQPANMGCQFPAF